MAILFDVGGTLWPDGPPDAGVLGIESRSLGPEGFLAAATARLEARGVDHEDAPLLAAALADDAVERARLEQDTLGHVRRVLAAAPRWCGLDPVDALDAMCVPAEDVLDPFPGGIELLGELASAGERLGLVSNSQWRSAARYREDFATWHADDLFDVYVSSLDVGLRKPHPAMFRQALESLGVSPSEAVMVGNSPAKDMAPARALGLRTVLVALQEPPADISHADDVVRSIAELREVLLDQLRG